MKIHNPIIVTPDGEQRNWILLQEDVASSSANSTLVIPNDFKMIKIELMNVVPVTDDVNLLVRVSANGGSTFATTNYEWAGKELTSSDVNIVNGSEGGFSFHRTGTATARVSNVAAEGGISGLVTFYDPLNPSVYTSMSAHGTFTQANATVTVGFIVGGKHEVARRTNALRVRFSSGNIASGTIRWYGRR